MTLQKTLVQILRDDNHTISIHETREVGPENFNGPIPNSGIGSKVINIK
jgi:hypothetical protein